MEAINIPALDKTEIERLERFLIRPKLVAQIAVEMNWATSTAHQKMQIYEAAGIARLVKIGNKIAYAAINPIFEDKSG